MAVFILLRSHLPSDEERAVRRQISRRHREQGSSSSHPLIYNSSSTAGSNIRKKMASVFGMNKDNTGRGKRTKKGVRGGQGWIQAASGDWDTDSGAEGAEVQTRSIGEMLSRSPMQKQVDQDGDDLHGIRLADRSSIVRDDEGPQDLPFTPPVLDENSPVLYSQVESVASSQNLVSPNPLRIAPTRLQIPDSPSPSSHDSLHSARRYGASPEPYHVRAGSDDLYEGHGGGRRDSGNVSIRTFHTGTKFIESL